MRLLFSDAGQHRLDDIVQAGVLCVFDFDGTLSPIVQQPDKAHLPPEVAERLVALSHHAPVAIITGRAVADIRARLTFEPDFLVGNHGLEGVPGWEKSGEQYRAMCRSWDETITAALQDRSRFDPAILIENKKYSLSVHYRLVRDQRATENALAALFATLTPPARVIAGKCVFNLLPQDAADKGSAFEQLMQITGARSAIYIGDDVTDEDVFKLSRRDLLSVRIEPAVDSAAEFFLPRRCDIVQLLDELIRRLQLRQSASTLPPASAGNA
jgi:trehalose 6-phosphate phosphatase